MVAVPRDSTTLLESVKETCNALHLGPQHSAMVRTAEMLAHTIDRMDAEMRARMLAQTVPPLLRVLEQLATSAGPVSPEVRGLTEQGLNLFLNELGIGDGPD